MWKCDKSYTTKVNDRIRIVVKTDDDIRVKEILFAYPVSSCGEPERLHRRIYCFDEYSEMKRLILSERSGLANIGGEMEGLLAERRRDIFDELKSQVPSLSDSLDNCLEMIIKSKSGFYTPTSIVAIP